jgi:redox-sensitive bicupin YhaK (pirin superfamily)
VTGVQTCALPIYGSFEHAIVPLDAPIRVGPEIIEPGWIGLIPQGLTALPIETRSDGRALLLGGKPLGGPITMWWNFVARTRQEIDDAYRDWSQRTDRFGDVESGLDRIDAPRPPWMREAE